MQADDAIDGGNDLGTLRGVVVGTKQVLLVGLVELLPVIRAESIQEQASQGQSQFGMPFEDDDSVSFGMPYCP